MQDVNNHLLAAKLVELRGARSLYRVAKAADVSRGTLYRYEQAVLVPNDQTLEKLAAFYNCDFKELKKLMLADSFPEGSRQRDILFEWVSEVQNK